MEQGRLIYSIFILLSLIFNTKIKENEKEFENGCKTLSIELINEDTKLNNLVFTDKNEYGYFPYILELIVNKQNSLIQRLH